MGISIPIIISLTKMYKQELHIYVHSFLMMLYALSL